MADRESTGTVPGTTGPAGLKEAVTTSPAAGRLKEEAAAYAAAQAQRLLAATGRKLGQTTARLNDVAEGRSPGLAKLAMESGKKFAQGKGPLRSAIEAGAGSIKDRAKEALQNMGGGKSKGGGGSGKFVTIIEDTDVGVPVREAYNQWTQFQEFSTFTKGVQSVETPDETTSNWRAKVFLSTRTWKADTTEQIPDERIAWTSEGAKGTLRGVVTFHALADNLTRVLLVIEYYSQGFFEKTGNIWRAQGRRARLDLKHFRRFVMMRGEATDGWRGEIRDSEVVRSHEEAVEAEGDAYAEEETEAESGDEAEAGREEEDQAEAESEDEGAGEEEEEEEEEAEEEDEGPYAEEDETESEFEREPEHVR